MVVIDAVGCGFCVVASGCAGIRWLRVAQREHYLPGSSIRFARRWWLANTSQVIAGIVAVVATALSLLFPILLVATAVVIVTGPFGLSLRGRTSKLRWTRRMITLGATTKLFSIAVIVVCGLAFGLLGAAFAAGVIAVLMPVVVDFALFVLGPFERHFARRYVQSATDRLSRVRPAIVGITGSYGKTSTKNYLAHFLGGQFHVVASPQSFNNQAGLARTVNELLVPGTDVLVAEMGAYQPGEIAALCAWLPPSVAVITAIGPVHLERFKTLERTLQAKSEITVSASTVVLNTDDERLVGLFNKLLGSGKRLIACSGTRREADVVVLGDDEDLEVIIDGQSFGRRSVPNAGGIARTNVACAIGAAVALGGDPTVIAERVSTLPVVEHRLEARSNSTGASVFDDTFNSNPVGVGLALRRLGDSASNFRRRVVVTPGMVELGVQQLEENMNFGRAIGQVATDVVVVGLTNRRALLRGLSMVELDQTSTRDFVGRPVVITVRNRNDAVAYVREHFGAGDAVLFENDLPDHYP